MASEKIGGFPVTTHPNTTGRAPKGIVYVCEYAVSDLQNFKVGLLERLPISDATLAPWTKSKNLQSRRFLDFF